jgi:hypothetical protein
LVVLILLAWIATVVGLFAAASVSVQTSGSSPPQQPIRAFGLPNLVGLKACHAERIVLNAGLRIDRIPRSRCGAIVIAQSPKPRDFVPYRERKRTTVTLRLRG